MDAPIAVASDGTIIVNATHLDAGTDPIAAVRRLLDEGHEIFVGVVVPNNLRRELLRDVDDAAADLVGRLGAKLGRRRAR
jgi:hypothetical protein